MNIYLFVLYTSLRLYVSVTLWSRAAVCGVVMENGLCGSRIKTSYFSGMMCWVLFIFSFPTSSPLCLTNIPPALNGLPSHLFPSSPSHPCTLTDGTQVQENLPRCYGKCFSTSVFVYKLWTWAHDLGLLFTSAARHRHLLLLLLGLPVRQPTTTQRRRERDTGAVGGFIYIRVSVRYLWTLRGWPGWAAVSANFSERSLTYKIPSE